MVKSATTTTGKKPSERSESKYKGVRKRKWGKWVSEIRLPNSRERIWLGSYDSAEKAARAFDAALFCLRGRSAKFNFPHNPPDIAGGRSLSPPEIQAAAQKFANLENSECIQSVSELQPEDSQSHSPSPSMVSDLTAQIDDSELAMDIPFLDLLVNSDSSMSNYASELFPGFDDLQDDFFKELPEPALNFAEDNFDGLPIQDSYLWNF